MDALAGAQTAHVTINTLVDYLDADGPRQRFAILQNMKNRLGRRAFAPYYQDARAAIRAHHSGNETALSSEIQRLRRALREVPEDPGDARTRLLRARLENNLRVVADYRESFGNISLQHTAMRFAPVTLRGVRVSTEPTLAGVLTVGSRKLSVNVIVDCGTEEPTAFTKEFTAELLARCSAQSHEVPTKGAQVWHASTGHTFALARLSVRRWENLQQACHEIALQWPTIG